MGEATLPILSVSGAHSPLLSPSDAEAGSPVRVNNPGSGSCNAVVRLSKGAVVDDDCLR